MLKRRQHKPQETRELWRDSLNAMTVGWNLAIPIFGGVLLGFILDRVFGTTYIFTIGLLVFGVFIGFYNLMRTIKKLDADAAKRQEAEKQEKEEK